MPGDGHVKDCAQLMIGLNAGPGLRLQAASSTGFSAALAHTIRFLAGHSAMLQGRAMVSAGLAGSAP